jgi:hypothetical protein
MTLPISLPTAPGVLDVSNTERANADALLRDLGIRQADVAAQTSASRAVAAQKIADSLDSTPLGTTPGTGVNPPNTAGPTWAGNYVQPNTSSPAPRPAGVVTAGNPLGA